MLKVEMILPSHVKLRIRALLSLPVGKKYEDCSRIDVYLFKGLFLSFESWHLRAATW